VNAARGRAGRPTATTSYRAVCGVRAPALGGGQRRLPDAAAGEFARHEQRGPRPAPRHDITPTSPPPRACGASEQASACAHRGSSVSRRGTTTSSARSRRRLGVGYHYEELATPRPAPRRALAEAALALVDEARELLRVNTRRTAPQRASLTLRLDGDFAESPDGRREQGAVRTTPRCARNLDCGSRVTTRASPRASTRARADRGYPQLLGSLDSPRGRCEPALG